MKTYQQMNKKERSAELERQMELYQQEIDRMDAKVKMLSNDRDSLERYARENFNFAEPGDDVYIVDK